MSVPVADVLAANQAKGRWSRAYAAADRWMLELGAAQSTPCSGQYTQVWSNVPGNRCSHGAAGEHGAAAGARPVIGTATVSFARAVGTLRP